VCTRVLQSKKGECSRELESFLIEKGGKSNIVLQEENFE
jgi:hypothetical protein